MVSSVAGPTEPMSCSELPRKTSPPAADRHPAERRAHPEGGHHLPGQFGRRVGQNDRRQEKGGVAVFLEHEDPLRLRDSDFEPLILFIYKEKDSQLSLPVADEDGEDFAFLRSFSLRCP
jgi:hypothetical protein